MYGLARLLNFKPEQTIELADEMSFFQTPAITVDQSLEATLATRPEMKVLAARGEALPKLTFGGTWAYQGMTTPVAAIPTYVYSGNSTSRSSRAGASRHRLRVRRSKFESSTSNVRKRRTRSCST